MLVSLGPANERGPDCQTYMILDLQNNMVAGLPSK